MTGDVLITDLLHHRCMSELEQRYTCHKLYLAEDRAALIAAVGSKVRAIAGRKVDDQLMAALPQLEIIANYGVGYDLVDVAAAKRRNIRVTNTPYVLNDAVAELTVGLMIALARQIPDGHAIVRDGAWPRQAIPLARELNGSTVGIVGLGRIGKEIARRLEAMRMNVVYHGRNRQDDQPYPYYGDLEAMAEVADWLVVAAPGGGATRGLVSRAVLQALGPQGTFVNIARGEIVDEAALIEMLGDGTLGGAALDVFENEPNIDPAFFSLPNVVLSAHRGSATEQTRIAMSLLVVENIDAQFAGRPLPSQVA